MLDAFVGQAKRKSKKSEKKPILTKISSDNSHSHPEALGENGRKFIYD
jgi:hypothetical protein